MRITIVILIATLIQVNAGTYAQKVTFERKNVKLQAVFKEIRKQTSYDFIYQDKILDNIKPINIKFSNLPFEEALQSLFEKQPLTYSISGKVVIVEEKKTSSFLGKFGATLLKIDVRGRILDEQKNPLPGATVKVKETKQSTITNDKGEFYLPNVSDKAVLMIAYVGYTSLEVTANKDLGDVELKLSENKLEEVKVTVNTGYQTLSKERATGSFSYVDNKLLNRSVSTDVLSRLDGVTSGLAFGKLANKANFLSSSNGGDPGISIRGRSTLFANTEPLIVLDNFPYDGDLKNINPNDIESVTVLKDAAAASIWGVRAGNGVIVITSKKGKINQSPKISFNSNITIGAKPNVYSVPQMSSSEFIDFERYLFDQGYYDLYLKYLPNNLQTPVVDLLEKIRDNPLDKDELNSKLNALREIDNRDDYTKYFLRNAVSQQYALNISGGSETNQYYISGGYDRNLSSLVSDSYSRFNLTANNHLNIIKDRLTLDANVLFTKSINKSNPDPYNYNSSPYDQLVDQNGNGLPIVQSYRQASKDALSNLGLLDWNYYPFNERYHNNSISNLSDYRLGLQLNYKILPKSLNVDLKYGYQQGNAGNESRRDLSYYSTRLIINQMSQTDPTGTINYPIPLGAILDNNSSTYKSNSARLQLNYNEEFSDKHEVNAIAGTEIKDYNSFQRFGRLYGYNQDTGIDFPVDYFSQYQQRIGYTAHIPYANRQDGGVDRFLSYFANASYIYDKKYIFSASARKDESNLFGVDANRKGVPLYSLGLSWDIGKERFYKNDFLPELRIRLTDGYNGNLSKNLSAYTTARISDVNIFNTAQQLIVNPPNPSLSWEKVHVINAGLDFGFTKNIIKGSIEFYSKKGLNLIGNSPVAPQSGMIQFTGNTADITTKGMDLTLTSTNVKGAVNWTTNFLFSYVADKVTAYRMQTGTNNSYVGKNYLNPFVGKSYAAIFAYPWGGLDNNGNPQGYLNNQITEDYSAILNSTNAKDLKYMGSSIPTSFGNLRNNIDYRGIEFSFNITYKFGYFFRRGSFNGNPDYKQADYSLRWKNPGDEKTTNVPSLIYPNDGLRDAFYNGSEVLVEKGDHIRLQDIQLSYKIEGKRNLGFSHIRLYAYATNLGILWRANNLGLDPDYSGNSSYNIPNPKTYSLGLRADF